jgi:AbrB family looped-hinge helix DNA binding protein
MILARCHVTALKARIGQGGRIVIPVQYRRAMGMAPGDEVVLLLGADGIRIVTSQQAVRRVQALVRQYVSRGRTLSEELSKERRTEMARE